MAEFSLIKRYCQNIGVTQTETTIGVGDDAAIVQIPTGKELVVSVDTLVENVHFFSNTKPERIAEKLVAVNLSDMAAMGATPKWATLALTMPELDESWLSEYSIALNNSCNQYGVQLIGGDTCQGPLVLSMQIMGLVEQGKALTRSNAQVGDDLYVSGALGDAALALAGLKGELNFLESELIELRPSLESPIPQVKLGQSLLELANACIDLSDGLIGDISHVAEQSSVSFSIEVDQLPLSNIYSRYLSAGGHLDYALSGGEDYQLAFTVSSKYKSKILDVSKKLDIKITKIGSVTKKLDRNVILTNKQQPYTLNNNAAYEHFLKSNK